MFQTAFSTFCKRSDNSSVSLFAPAFTVLFGVSLMASHALAESPPHQDRDLPASRPTNPGRKPLRTSPEWTVRLGTGLDYSSGLYGDIAPTRVTSVPLSISAVRGGWRLRASVPYVRLQGPASLVELEGASVPGSAGADNSTISSGGRAGQRRIRGLGDLSLSASYEKKLTSHGLWLETSTRVKLPTGSKRKGLSSGKADLTLSVDLSRDIGYGNIYVSGRRRLAGHSAEFPVRSTWGAGLGASYDVTEKFSAGIDYDWEQSAYALDPDIREVTAWGSYRVRPDLRIQIYGTQGENDSSADTAFGAGLSWRMN